MAADKRPGAASRRRYIICSIGATARRERGENGAGDRSRTDDFDLGKVALYQLSYTRPAKDLTL